MSNSLRVETVATLAERLGLSRDSIAREVVHGRLPYVNVGGHWRFREQDIEYWLEHHAPEHDARLRLIKGQQTA